MKAVDRKGELTRAGKHKAHTLMSLPRVQAEVDALFDEAGLSMKDCIDVIREIVTDAGQPAEVRLRGVDMRIRMTTGYAPNRNFNLNASLDGDKFFEEKVFSDGAPPKV